MAQRLFSYVSCVSNVNVGFVQSVVAPEINHYEWRVTRGLNRASILKRVRWLVIVASRHLFIE